VRHIYRTGTPLPSKHPILYILSTNIPTEFFKHAAHFPFFSLQNAVCVIILPFLVHVLFTFYFQGVLKFKNKFGSLKVNIAMNLVRDSIVTVVIRLWPGRFGVRFFAWAGIFLLRNVKTRSSTCPVSC
jgi:hypothetical protein